MRYTLLSILAVLLLSTSLFAWSWFAAKGKLRIQSDIKKAFVYVNGEKKAMTGKGYTNIMLDEGEYTITVKKAIDEYREYFAQEEVFIGADSSVKLDFKLKTVLTEKGKTQQKKLKAQGVWQDPDTALMWQKQSYTQKEVKCFWGKGNCNHGKVGNWNYAKKYCTNLDHAGYTDWRLPTIEELETLLNIKDYFKWGRDGGYDEWEQWFNKNKHKRHLSNNGHRYFIKRALLDNMPPHPKGWSGYWSSTTSAGGTSNAWNVNFSDGDGDGNSKSYSGFVRCVR